MATFHLPSARKTCNHNFMTLKLTSEMREALQSQAGQPVTIEDEQTHRHYVLLPLDIYERIQSIFMNGFDVADSYAAQSQVARAAGWDDEAMDLYVHYDAHRSNP